MAYSPGVADTSGQIRAGYIAEGGKDTANAITNILGNWNLNEQERQTTSKLTAGKIASNPFLQQQAQSNPDIAALLDKVSSGNANLAQTRQLAGWAAGAEAGQQAKQLAAMQTAQLGNVNAQADLARANMNDVNSQAGQRAQELAMKKAQFDMMQRIFNPGQPTAQGQPQGAPPMQSQPPMAGNPFLQNSGVNFTPSASPQQAPPSGLPAFLSLSGQPAPAAQAQPQGAPNQPSASQQSSPQAPSSGMGFAPTSPQPTLAGNFVNGVQSTGQFLSQDVAAKLQKDTSDAWAKIEQPRGVVPGKPVNDPDGNKMQEYFLVTHNNDGTITKTKEPMLFPAGAKIPFPVLDPSNGYNLAKDQPSGAQPILLTQKAKDDIVDASSNIVKLTQGLQLLGQMEDANNEMISKRWGRTSSFTGWGPINNIVEPYMEDNSGQRFDSLASKFQADVMSGLRNIRNVYEFNATTGDIPAAWKVPSVRTELIATLKNRMIQDLQRNMTAVQLEKAGASPDSAWSQTAENLVRDVVGKMPGVANPAASGAATAAAPQATTALPPLQILSIKPK